MSNISPNETETQEKWATNQFSNQYPTQFSTFQCSDNASRDVPKEQHRIHHPYSSWDQGRAVPPLLDAYGMPIPPLPPFSVAGTNSYVTYQGQGLCGYQSGSHISCLCSGNVFFILTNKENMYFIIKQTQEN